MGAGCVAVRSRRRPGACACVSGVQPRPMVPTRRGQLPLCLSQDRSRPPIESRASGRATRPRAASPPPRSEAACGAAGRGAGGDHSRFHIHPSVPSLSLVWRPNPPHPPSGFAAAHAPTRPRPRGGLPRATAVAAHASCRVGAESRPPACPAPARARHAAQQQHASRRRRRRRRGRPPNAAAISPPPACERLRASPVSPPASGAGRVAPTAGGAGVRVCGGGGRGRVGETMWGWGCGVA